MNRSLAIELLKQSRPMLASRYGVANIALFGSAARDELRAGSDIDILVEFEGPATFDGYFGLKDYLEQLFDRPVDLVTEKGLKPRSRPYVERDLVRVA